MQTTDSRLDARAPGHPGRKLRLGLPPLALVHLIGLTLGWGLTWPIMKIGLNEIPPLAFRAIVTPLGALALVAVTLATRERLGVPRGRWGALALASSFNMIGWFVFMAFGLAILRSGEAAIMAYTMPVWAAILSYFVLGERLTHRLLAGLVLGLAGIGILTLDGFGSFRAAPLGVAFMLLAALSWASGTVVQKRVDWRMPVIAVTAWQLAIATPPMILAGVLLDDPDLTTVSVAAWFAVTYTVVVATAYCFYAWFKILSLVPAMVSAISVLAIPVVGVAGGGIVLGEAVGWRELVALVLVCGALSLVLLQRGDRRV
ncbi:MAG: DMT family transporter [Alphaproteobacteria bacterium]